MTPAMQRYLYSDANRELFRHSVANLVAHATGVPPKYIIDEMSVDGTWQKYTIHITNDLYDVLEKFGVCVFDPCYDEPYLTAIRKNFS